MPKNERTKKIDRKRDETRRREKWRRARATCSPNLSPSTYFPPQAFWHGHALSLIYNAGQLIAHERKLQSLSKYSHVLLRYREESQNTQVQKTLEHERARDSLLFLKCSYVEWET